LLGVLAVAGTFLPWTSLPGFGGFGQGSIEGERDEGARMAGAFRSLLAGDGISVRGYQGEGKYVTLLLFLGLGACWISLARWLRPLSLRPGPLLVVGCLLLFAATILTFLQGLAMLKPPLPLGARPAHGLWITLGAALLASLASLLALRQAVQAAIVRFARESAF